MPPFRRPHLSHRLLMLVSGGVAFGGPPDLCCHRNNSYTALQKPLPANALTWGSMHKSSHVPRSRATSSDIAYLFLPTHLNHTSYAAFSWREAALNSSCACMYASALSKSFPEGPRTLGLGGSSSLRIRASRGPHCGGPGAEALNAS